MPEHTTQRFITTALIALCVWSVWNLFASHAEAQIAPEQTSSSNPVKPQPQSQSPFIYYFPLVSANLPCPTGWLPLVDWDPRLGPGGLPFLENVRIIPARVAPCQRFWRAVRVRFEDVSESGGSHSVFVKIIDENGARVAGKQARFYGEGSGDYPDPAEKSSDDPCDCNFEFEMWGDSYGTYISDGIPKDIVAGMVMPMRERVSYRITFQRVIDPQP